MVTWWGVLKTSFRRLFKQKWALPWVNILEKKKRIGLFWPIKTTGFKASILHVYKQAIGHQSLFSMQIDHRNHDILTAAASAACSTSLLSSGTFGHLLDGRSPAAHNTESRFAEAICYGENLWYMDAANGTPDWRYTNWLCLKRMNASITIVVIYLWTRSSLIPGSHMLIIDGETNEVVERFPVSLIQQPTAFNHPNHIYNNILILTVQHPDENQGSNGNLFNPFHAHQILILTTI